MVDHILEIPRLVVGVLWNYKIMLTKWSGLEQRQYKSRHLIPMFIVTPCIKTRNCRHFPSDISSYVTVVNRTWTVYHGIMSTIPLKSWLIWPINEKTSWPKGMTRSPSVSSGPIRYIHSGIIPRAAMVLKGIFSVINGT